MSVAAKDMILANVSLHVKDRGVTLVKKLSGRYHALPVVNDDREVMGLVTEESILKALREEKTIFECTAGSLMTCGHLGHDSCRRPLTVSPDMPIGEVLQTMLRERLSTIPVVKNRVLVGVINRADLTLSKKQESELRRSAPGPT
jgi:CBS domain-containing protein